MESIGTLVSVQFKFQQTEQQHGQFQLLQQINIM